MNAPDDSTSLLFAWDKTRRFRFVLPTFLLLSLLAHGATFFLFQIAESGRVSIPPPAPEVSLLLPTTPENRSLLRRIAAEDPALIAAATSVVPPGLAEVRYQPSYETVRTQPRSVPELSAAVQFPPPRDPLAIIRSTAAPGIAAGAAPPPRATLVSFSTALDARLPQAVPWKFAQRAAAPLEAASFLIGVTDRGEVSFVFLQRTSGDPALDRQAAAQLPQLTFQHGTEAVAWGVATIAWGDDAYGDSPKRE